MFIEFLFPRLLGSRHVSIKVLVFWFLWKTSQNWLLQVFRKVQKFCQNFWISDNAWILALKITFFRCPWIYHARTSPGKCLHFDEFAIWQQMHLCVPFAINFYFWHEIVVLPNQQEVVKNNTICSSLQKKTEKIYFDLMEEQFKRYSFITKTHSSEHCFLEGLRVIFCLARKVLKIEYFAV